MNDGSGTELPVLQAGQATIWQAMQAIDQYAMNIVLVVDKSERLIGLATDGDLRRALLSGAEFHDSVLPFVETKPITADFGESRAVVLDRMLSRGIEQIPVIDPSGRIRGMHVMRELIGRQQKTNSALILAGGKGSRLGRQTQQIPKPMTHVAGRPILERLIDHLVGFGISDITISVGHLADVVVGYFGDGTRHGCRISYLREDPEEPRGTGGPFVDLVNSAVSMSEPVLVLNGDLVTNADLESLVEEHKLNKADVTVAMHIYAREIPYGVIREREPGWVSSIEEKPVLEMPVSAGIYVIQPHVAYGMPRSGELPMTHLIAKCLTRGGRVRSFAIQSEWHDIGTPEDLAKARGYSIDR